MGAAMEGGEGCGYGGGVVVVRRRGESAEVQVDAL
jgi:hypothetical protein